MDTSPIPPARREREEKNKKNKRRRSHVNWKWVFTVFGLSLLISMVLAVLSSTLETMNIFVGFIVLLLVIALGVVFDYIGLAVASADAGNFHSMAAHGSPYGAKGVWLINNAEKVSSFCNDVIGDISGILSGAIGATLSISLFAADTPWGFWGDLLLSGAISAITVGGKAIFKGLALANSQKVVYFLCGVLCLFSRKKQPQKAKKKQK
ncbi:MAG: hypothetical protein IKT43_00315 [Clostridia bacterium]|nr:hypothetical protein [Clostridia bacterium]